MRSIIFAADCTLAPAFTVGADEATVDSVAVAIPTFHCVGFYYSPVVKHTVSRNNILLVRESRDYSASAGKQKIDNDFDYDP